MRYCLTLVAALCAFLSTPAASAAYTSDDTFQAIEDAANNHGVSRSTLYRIVKCETGATFNPHVVGDHGSSFGAVQLNNLDTGLYWHFLRVGYDDANNPYEALDYLARVATGEFARQGITLQRWMCF